MISFRRSGLQYRFYNYLLVLRWFSAGRVNASFDGLRGRDAPPPPPQLDLSAEYALNSSHGLHFTTLKLSSSGILTKVNLGLEFGLALYTRLDLSVSACADVVAVEDVHCKDRKRHQFLSFRFFFFF